MNFIRSFFVGKRFFYAGAVLVLVLIGGYIFSWLYILGLIALAILSALFIADILLLYHPYNSVSATRVAPKFFSLSDENEVKYHVYCRAYIKLNIRLIDELPMQFQERDFQLIFHQLPSEHQETSTITLRPVSRGSYEFGSIILYSSTFLGLAMRRHKILSNEEIKCYPSVIQMKKFELMTFAQTALHGGIKKVRRIGHNYEFEQIKNYTLGDDYRSINWKASARHGSLMVNQYEDEKSQNIYCILDKSRSMRMPFYGLRLLDYAINSTLAISNIAIKKSDKVGLISFSDQVQHFISASKKSFQLRHILDALYAEKENEYESDFEYLFSFVRQRVKRRSLFFLFTNFESFHSLERKLPLLRRLNRTHLLVVVFFKNTEIEDFVKKESESLLEIYEKTIGENLLNEKEQIVLMLNNYGIQTVFTNPEDLTMNTINKYLELKAKGLA